MTAATGRMNQRTLVHDLKCELAGARIIRPSARIAEIAGVLRFASEITEDPQGVGGVVMEVELDNKAVAQRLEGNIHEIAEVECVMRNISPGGNRKEPRYILRITKGAEHVLRRTGLISRSGQPVVGLPPHIVSGHVVHHEAVWRGAVMAAGVLSAPERTPTLEVHCPCLEAGLALVGCGRKLGIPVRPKETRGVDRVVVRDTESIGALLSRMGAHRTRLLWDLERERCAESNSRNRLPIFDDANLRRSARAAEAAALRVERALELLGDDAPEHLVEAGNLRTAHRHESLEELGRLADPPITKDAIAGRIRRLLSMADKRAKERGLPDTKSAIPDDLKD